MLNRDEHLHLVIFFDLPSSMDIVSIFHGYREFYFRRQCSFEVPKWSTANYYLITSCTIRTIGRETTVPPYPVENYSWDRVEAGIAEPWIVYSAASRDRWGWPWQFLLESLVVEGCLWPLPRADSLNIVNAQRVQSHVYVPRRCVHCRDLDSPCEYRAHAHARTHTHTHRVE